MICFRCGPSNEVFNYFILFGNNFELREKLLEYDKKPVRTFDSHSPIVNVLLY